MNKLSVNFLSVLLTACAVLPNVVFAERGFRYFPVPIGNSYAEVLTLLGSPKERIERESLREEIWIYPNQKVLFREGKVNSSERRDGKFSAARAEEALPPEPELKTEVPVKRVVVTSPNLLTDIMREVEKHGSDKPSSPGAGTYVTGGVANSNGANIPSMNQPPSIPPPMPVMPLGLIDPDMIE